MSLEFKYYKIDNIGEVVSGGTPSTSKNEYWYGDIGWITPKDLSSYDDIYISRGERNISSEGLNNSSAKLVPKNTVLMTSRAPIGYIAIANNELSTNQGFKSLICDEKICHYKYFYYWLKLNIKYIINNSNGSTFKEISGGTFKNLEISLPSISEQKAISSVLWTIDEKISVLKKINRNLQNLIKILYKEYFESFELDNVPDDWELVNIGSIIDIYNGYSYKGTELQESDCGMVTIKNFNRDGSFRIDGFKEIVYSNKIKKHHFINENDILISCTDVTQDADIIGNCIIVLDKQNYDELIMSMDLVKIESKISEINNFLLASIFKSYNFKKHILGYVNGTTVLHLDKKGIKKFKIALPKDLSELKNISERFELIYAEIQCNQKEINKLTKLRDTLLPKLMSGEIDVSKIEM